MSTLQLCPALCVRGWLGLPHSMAAPGGPGDTEEAEALLMTQPQTPFSISFSYLEPVRCSMFSSNYCFFTCIQISQEAGKAVWYSHFLKNILQFVVIHTKALAQSMKQIFFFGITLLFL